jgi:hypothetical protein
MQLLTSGQTTSLLMLVLPLFTRPLLQRLRSMGLRHFFGK